MKRALYPLLALAVLSLLPACKPTEKNYKAAYDLAQRRERDDLDEELFRKMKQEGLPKMEIFGTDTLRVAPREPLLIYWNPAVNDTPQENGLGVPRIYSLVIGIYRNPANALAHASQFLPDGANAAQIKGASAAPGSASAAPGIASAASGQLWLPMVLRNPLDDIYYVSLATSDTLSALVPQHREFLTRGLPTVGTDRPLVRTRR